MGRYSQKIWFFVILGLVLTSVFTFGQIFYYNQKVADIVNATPTAISKEFSTSISSILDQKLILKYGDREFTVSYAELKTWVERYNRAYTGTEELRVSRNRLESYLKKISKEINTEPVNAKLVVDNNTVSEFEPPRAGQQLNISASISNIIASLIRNNHKRDANDKVITARLAVDEVEPDITLDKANALGIDTLLTVGESDFSGSPKSRIHNIAVGSKRVTGILVKPGDEFSFNQLLGSVDAASGYLPELVIKKGALVSEYGGGICQVSTTLFRAAAMAGLPILERHPHSLPVRYYNPQGFDATIYPGVSDFRFKNDTLAHILIQSKVTGGRVYFEIYGTLDNRKVKIDGPRQYDIQQNGAMKTELTRTVTYADGTEKSDVFRSSYKAPGSFPIVRNPLE